MTFETLMKPVRQGQGDWNLTAEEKGDPLAGYLLWAPTLRTELEIERVGKVWEQSCRSTIPSSFNR